MTCTPINLCTHGWISPDNRQSLVFRWEKVVATAGSEVTAASTEELEQQNILKSQQEGGKNSLEDTDTPETLKQSPGWG